MKTALHSVAAVAFLATAGSSAAFGQTPPPPPPFPTLPTDGPINVAKLATYWPGVWQNAVPNDNSDDSVAVQAVVAYLGANAAPLNRTLYFPSGVYNFAIPQVGTSAIISISSAQLGVDNRLSVVGDGDKSEIVLGYDNAYKWLGAFLEARENSKIELANLTIRSAAGVVIGSPQAIPRAVVAYGVRDLRVQDVHFSGFGLTKEGIPGRPATILVGGTLTSTGWRSADGVVISGCVFRNESLGNNVAFSDVYVLSGCRNVTITNNQFLGRTDIGVFVQPDDSTADASRDGKHGQFIVSDNIIENKHRHGIGLSYENPVAAFYDIAIVGNVIKNCGWSGVYYYDHGSHVIKEVGWDGGFVIANNVIENNGGSAYAEQSNRSGIYMTGRRGSVSIVGNSVVKNLIGGSAAGNVGGRSGIYLQECQDVSIVGNTVERSHGSGIFVNSPETVHISGNLLNGNCWGVGGSPGSAGMNDTTHLAVTGQARMPRQISITDNVITDGFSASGGNNRHQALITGILIGPQPDQGNTTTSFVTVTGNSISGNRQAWDGNTGNLPPIETASAGIWTRGPVSGQIKDNIIRNFYFGVRMGSESGSQNFAPNDKIVPTLKLQIDGSSNRTWNVGDAFHEERPI
jgi:parallel beta-helix repeat protein